MTPNLFVTFTPLFYKQKECIRESIAGYVLGTVLSPG